MTKRPLPLDPYARSTLRAVLTPPDNYELDHALGTAYSIDAKTLVTIPLFAAGLCDTERNKSVGISKIYALGSRLTLLVQGDRISISQPWISSKPLLKLVGDAVVPCSIADGSFHPKLLVMRFTAMDDPSKKLMRVVISTRNLTSDNSWDSVVVLDEASSGVLIPGLADAVKDLARFVNDSAHPAIRQCKEFGKALETIRFQPIPGLADLEVRLFYPGNRNAVDVFQKLKGDDLLVISPFVRKSTLDKLAAQAGARAENRWLVTLPVDVPDSAFSAYKVFKIVDDGDRLKGVHAKIYLASSKKLGTRVVITSANATEKGWRDNVEIAVTGHAKSKALHIPSLMSESDAQDARNFRSLLERITPLGVEKAEKEPDWVMDARKVLAGAVVLGNIVKGPPRLLQLKVRFDTGRDWPEGVSVKMRPFGHNDTVMLSIGDGEMSGELTIEPGIELTPFVTLALTQGDHSIELVIALRLEGDVDWDRNAARKTLAQAARPDLYRELLWYFGEKGAGSQAGDDEEPAPKPAGKAKKNPSHLPILEKMLLRVQGPNKENEIATIDGLLAGLSDDPEDAALLATWNLVKSACK